MQAGDASAARELYDAHVDRVYRLVYRLAGDPDQAQDYTQEAFIRAFDRLSDFRGDSALGTWIWISSCASPARSTSCRMVIAPSSSCTMWKAIPMRRSAGR